MALVLASQPALAYIGPGAGFAAAGSVLVLAGTFLLAFGIILIWPLKAVVRVFTSRGNAKAKVKRMIVVGLDGFDPGLAKKYMDEGRMPNFKKLAEEGCFSPLQTAIPSISPVAWSTYATGVDASRHNIYDFLTRDPCSYMPVLSSTDTRSVPRSINLGFAKVPFGSRAIYKILQKSQPFWKLLGANNVWSSIIRVPITFPAQKFKNGTLLSGMCVPDLQGTQGSFSFYSTRSRGADSHIGGQQFKITIRNGKVESALKGPTGSDGHSMKSPFTVELDESTRRVKITVGKETEEVGFQEYTPWMVVPFDGVQGIARIYIQTWDEDEFGIYVTPINIDPDKPAMPISHPFVYAIYLAKLLGRFATLGLAEDTWALNERVIDEKAFLEQAYLIFEERKKQLWNVLEKTKRGFVTVVFDTTDRISHMFYRYLDPTHPANEGKDTEIYKNVIPELYEKMDAFLPEIRAKIGEDEDTIFMVISDHGFCNFRRGVNLNSWLRDEGYLVLKDGETTSGDWFQKVDWSKTRAFTLGLTGIFINRVGRERQGIVEKGEEMDALTAEIAAKLEKLTDPQSGDEVINEVFFTQQIHDGPYADVAPELLIGYNKSFRHSWDCATGAVSKDIFSDNTKSWSGDHCVDPRFVPGVFWCNRKINTEQPNLHDIAPTALDQFGVPIPAYMIGKSLFGEATGGGSRGSLPALEKSAAGESA
ncbi:MAG: putative AlkP superfamily phosphohydrolase/phosphomutase [Planctomycetota bacterium]|jgi:predicted AlkP superfamily phosphohydrolase/phosphomutase